MAEGKMKLNPAIFGVKQIDPGFIYVVENNGFYKIGKSKNGFKRVIEAKTWLPDIKIIGIKPFWSYSRLERKMHAGFSTGWYSGEWFRFSHKDDEDILLRGFSEFSDFDRDRNSVDFIYWFNGNGMSEFVIELNRQGVSLKKFLREESWSSKAKTASARNAENEQ